MPSLNQTASRVASILRKPFNHELKERIKDSLRSLGAARLRQSIEKNGIDSFYTLSYTVELQSVDLLDNCNITIGCPILRSINTIVEPIRIKSDIPFQFVGTLDGISFTYISDLSKLKSLSRLRYIGDTYFYTIKNRYLYLFNAKRIKYVEVNAAFVDPTQAVDSCTSAACVTDDDEWPMPTDLINGMITEILKTEFGITQPIDTEVHVDKSNEK